MHKLSPDAAKATTVAHQEVTGEVHAQATASIRTTFSDIDLAYMTSMKARVFPVTKMQEA